MSCPRRLLFSTPVILASLAIPARGAPLSYRQYLDHGGPASQSLALPPLAGPAHVPTFTDGGLIAFAVHHHGSPVLNDPGIEVQLFHAVSAVRDADPARFDRTHPQLGSLLGNPDLFRYLLYRYDLAPARFARNHMHLIPVLRGEALAMMVHRAPTAMSQGALPETITAPGASPEIPAPETIGATPPPVPSSGIPGMATVPAPPGIVLMLIGLGIVGMVIRGVDRAA